MSGGIPQFKIRVVKATDEELKLLIYEGSTIKASVVAKRAKARVRLAGFAEGKQLPIGYCEAKDEINVECAKLWAARAWEHVGLPGVEEVGEAVAEALRNWDHYTLVEEARRLYEEAVNRPLLEKANEEGRVVRVYATNGIERTTLGIIIVGSGCIAVSEGTLAEVEVVEEGELTRKVKPVVVAVEHSDSVKTTWEVLDRDIAITLCGKPVLFRAGKLGEIDVPLQTLARVETLNEVLLGKIGDSETWSKAGALVLEELRRRIWFKDDRVYHVLAAFILFTYFWDLFSTVPYIWFTGPPGSGKTHANFTVTFMSRHGIPLVEVTKASIFRIADAFKPTLAVDESTIPRDVALLLAAGYKRGVKVPRVELTKSGIKLAFFDPHSPKIFSYVDPPDDLFVLDRSVIINMIKGEPPYIETPDAHEFTHIRELLYKLRLLKIKDVIEASKVAGRILDERGVRGRPRELWHPLLTAAVLMGQNVVDSVVSFMSDYLKYRVLPYEEEHMVLAALEELFEEEHKRQRLGALDPERLVVTFKASDLTERIVEMKLEELGLKPEDKQLYEEERRRLTRQWDHRKVGRILHRLNLGVYQKRSGKPGERVYTVPLQAFLDLAVRYGYEVTKDWLTKLTRGVVSQCQQCQPPTETPTVTTDKTMGAVQEADNKPSETPTPSTSLTRTGQVSVSTEQLTGEVYTKRVGGIANHSERGGVFQELMSAVLCRMM
jgi:hypothetical protein